MRHQHSESLVPVTPFGRECVALQRPERSHGLNLVIEAVRLFTSAMGAAVALTDSTGLRCAASAGDAPLKGSAVALEGTLAGECFRTGQVVTADERRTVDAFTLPTFTILLLPIRQQGATVGILGLFWRESRSLSENTLAVAHAAASMVSIALEQPEEEVQSGMPASATVSSPAANAPVTLAANAPTVTLADSPKSLPARRAPAQTATPSKLYGLPCSNCGSYFFSDESVCPVCHTAQ